jgi:hypothetical protein
MLVGRLPLLSGRHGQKGIWPCCSQWASTHLNFYRTHLIFFTLGPLIVSGIFYASNGETHVDYIDCLFLCTSAFTVTGLNSALLAPLTKWQQVILFICMCLYVPPSPR